MREYQPIYKLFGFTSRSRHFAAQAGRPSPLTAAFSFPTIAEPVLRARWYRTLTAAFSFTTSAGWFYPFSPPNRCLLCHTGEKKAISPPMLRNWH